MWYPRCQREGKDSLELHTTPVLVQPVVGHLGCKGSVTITLSLSNTRVSRPFPSEPLFSLSASSLFWCMGGIVLPIPSPVQNWTFACADFHYLPVCSSLWTGRIPLNGNQVLCHIHHSSQLISMQKLAENLLWGSWKQFMEEIICKAEQGTEFWEAHLNLDWTQMPLNWMSKLTHKTPIRAYELHTCSRRLLLDAQETFCWSYSDR